VSALRQRSPRRPLRWAAVGLAACLAGTALEDAPAQEGGAFLRVDLNVGGRVTEVLTPDLNGDGRLDLFVVRGREALVTFQGEDGTWPTEPNQRFRFHPRTVLFDVGDLDGDGRAEVALLQAKGVFAYRLQERRGRLLYGLRPHRVLASESFFDRPVREEVRRKQFLRDFDQDGDLDLILPKRDGFSLLRNDGAGAFAEARALAVPPTAILNLGRTRLSSQLFASYWFANPNVAQWDGEGSPELVLARDGEVSCYDVPEAGAPQLRGRWTIPEQKQFSLNVENPLELDFNLPLVLRDVNRDGRVDVSATHVGKGTTRLYLNRAPEKEALSSPAASFRAKGVTFLSYYVDADGDGREDLILPRADKLSAWAIVKAFLTRSVPIEMLVFYQRDDGSFPSEPDDSRDLEIPVSLNSSGDRLQLGTSVVASIDGDFDGDGRKDLLYRTEPTTISFYRGLDRAGAQEGLGGLSEDAGATAEVPNVEDHRFCLAQVADLDGDGRHDVILRYQSWDREGDRLTLLISRWRP
jgi:hypothetical protein